MALDISFDSVKRARTLAERGLDFADAPRLFAGLTYTRPDERLVMVVWAQTETGRRIISMRKCNEREQYWFGQLD